MISFLRDLILRDFWLKLFSLGLAGLLWFTVNMMSAKNPVPALTLGPVQKRTLSGLPVLIVSSAADSRRFRVDPKEIAVTVQGDRKTIEALQGKDVRVLVDLTGIEAAPYLMKRVEVSTPAGVTQVAVQPQEVRVIFSSKSE